MNSDLREELANTIVHMYRFGTDYDVTSTRRGQCTPLIKAPYSERKWIGMFGQTSHEDVERTLKSDARSNGVKGDIKIGFDHWGNISLYFLRSHKEVWGDVCTEVVKLPFRLASFIIKFLVVGVISVIICRALFELILRVL